MFSPSQFKPAWWLTNPHLQTIVSKWFRRHIKVNTITETLELPDGDFIDLAWTERPTSDDLRPIVVVLHGLEGSVDSHYAKGMLNAIRNNGWLAVLMHFRSCSGRPNRQASSYHSGDTRDVDYFTEHLKQHYPNNPLAILGFSLGGTVLAHYLATQPNNPYLASCLICAPLHLASSSAKVNQGLGKIYQRFLLTKLKRNTSRKITLGLINHLNQGQLQAIKTLKEFDHKVTAPLNGFASGDDYYQQASPRSLIAKINQPCLIIHASDDPLLCHSHTTAIEPLPNNVRFEVSHYGGHVGFVYGCSPFKPEFWLEQRVPEFFQAIFNTNHRANK